MKKRKLQNGNATSAQSSGDLKADTLLQFYMQDVSFAVPQRKKLTLEITAGFLRARNQTSKEVEFGVHLDNIRMSRTMVDGIGVNADNVVGSQQSTSCASPFPRRTSDNLISALSPNMRTASTHHLKV